MPDVHAVEDADDDERGSERWAQGIDALDDVHGGGSGDRDGRRRDRRHEDLVRGEPATLGAGDRDEPARGVAQAIVLGGRRETPGWADELAAGDRRGLLVGEHHDRERIEARIERLQVPEQPGRALGGGGEQVVESDRVVQPERA